MGGTHVHELLDLALLEAGFEFPLLGVGESRGWGVSLDWLVGWVGGRVGGHTRRPFWAVVFGWVGLFWWRRWNWWWLFFGMLAVVLLGMTTGKKMVVSDGSTRHRALTAGAERDRAWAEAEPAGCGGVSGRHLELSADPASSPLNSRGLQRTTPDASITGTTDLVTSSTVGVTARPMSARYLGPRTWS